MKQITVMLTVLVMILTVIFSSSGASTYATYQSQTIFQGQTVFLNAEDEGYVNDEPAQVIHTGIVYANSFQIRDVLLLNSVNTIVADHSTSGGIGKPQYLFTNISSDVFELQQDVEFEGWDLAYNTAFETDEGDYMYVYKYGNTSVGVSENDFSIIEDGGKYLLLQQSASTLTVAEIEEPFKLGITEIVSLSLILVVIAIIAYWSSKYFKDWRMAG